MDEKTQMFISLVAKSWNTHHCDKDDSVTQIMHYFADTCCKLDEVMNLYRRINNGWLSPKTFNIPTFVFDITLFGLTYGHNPIILSDLTEDEIELLHDVDIIDEDLCSRALYQREQPSLDTIDPDDLTRSGNVMTQTTEDKLTALDALVELIPKANGPICWDAETLNDEIEETKNKLRYLISIRDK